MDHVVEAVLLEIQYLPAIPYVAQFIKYPKIYLEAQENYRKGTYRNRCHIASANGLLRLSIPLKKGKNEQQAITEVEISYSEPWQSVHWHSIRSAYGNAPFFDFYAADLQPFFESKPSHLFEWNLDLLKFVLEQIGLDDNLALTSTFQKETPPEIMDLRNRILPKKSRPNNQKAFSHVPYPQVFVEKNGFMPNLSILDLLFCKGPESILVLESVEASIII